jgi:hypothetical protein
LQIEVTAKPFENQTYFVLTDLKVPGAQFGDDSLNVDL